MNFEGHRTSPNQQNVSRSSLVITVGESQQSGDIIDRYHPTFPSFPSNYHFLGHEKFPLLLSRSNQSFVAHPSLIAKHHIFIDFPTHSLFSHFPGPFLVTSVPISNSGIGMRHFSFPPLVTYSSPAPIPSLLSTTVSHSFSLFHSPYQSFLLCSITLCNASNSYPLTYSLVTILADILSLP